ncbi:inner membrane protein [Obelidium mucronatum]|nr:inner membrane protein [Obelidium mucronatum]
MGTFFAIPALRRKLLPIATAAPRLRLPQLPLAPRRRLLSTKLPGLAAAGAILAGASVLAPALAAPLVPVAIASGVAAGAVLPAPLLAKIKPGAAFAGATILRAGIVCVGLKLSLLDAASYLQLCVPVVLPTLAVTLASVIALTRLLKLHPEFGTLMAAGTGICGITAISTVAPVIAASETYFAVAVANVIVFGMLGMLVYPTVAHWLFYSDEDKDDTVAQEGGIRPSTKAGLFLGVCIHDSSQVLGAAMSFRDTYDDQEAFSVATVTKLMRNSLLVFVVPVLALVHSKMSSAQMAVGHAVKSPPILPGFVLGFIGMAAVRSSVDYYFANTGQLETERKSQWKHVTAFVSDVVGTKFCLGMAMAGVGLNTRLSVLKGVGWKPFLVGGTGAGIAAITGYTCIELLDSYYKAQKT